MTAKTDNETENHVAEARRMSMRTIENWEYLTDEEKHGTLHQIVDRLAKSGGFGDE